MSCKFGIHCTRRETCKKIGHEICPYGLACTKCHKADVPSKTGGAAKKQCDNFVKGTCTWGEKCKFLHLDFVCPEVRNKPPVAASSEFSGGGGGITTSEPVAVANQYNLPKYAYDGSKKSITDAVGIQDFYQFLIYVFGRDAIVTPIKEEFNTYFMGLNQEEKKFMLNCLLISFYPSAEALEIEDNTPLGWYDRFYALVDATKMFNVRGQTLAPNVIKNNAFDLNKFDIEFSKGEIIKAFVEENKSNFFHEQEQEQEQEQEHDKNCKCCQGSINSCACIMIRGFDECAICFIDDLDEFDEFDDPDEFDE
jgi:hypothetical protein